MDSIFFFFFFLTEFHEKTLAGERVSDKAALLAVFIH